MLRCAVDAARLGLVERTKPRDHGCDIWLLPARHALFALGPALKLSRTAVVTDLKEHAGEDVVRRRWKFLPRNPLVVLQIAFSLALLTAAALFIRGAGKAASVDTGLKPGASFLLEVDASLGGYEPEPRTGTLSESERETGRFAWRGACQYFGNDSVGDDFVSKNVQRAGVSPGAGRETCDRCRRSCVQGCLEQRWRGLFCDRWSAGAARSRIYGAETTQPGPEVAIIDEALAKKLWPDGDALGQRIQYARRKGQKHEGTDAK